MAKTREQKRAEARDRLAASVIADYHWLQTTRPKPPEPPTVIATRAADVVRAQRAHEERLACYERAVRYTTTRFTTNKTRLTQLNLLCGLPPYTLALDGPKVGLTAFVFPETSP